MIPQVLYQSISKGPLQQSTRSTRPDHHSHLLAEEENTDRRCQLRFLYGSRDRDELRRVEQANAETGGEDVERLPHVDRAPPSDEYEDIATDTNCCSDDGHNFVPLCPVIYVTSEVSRCVELSAGRKPALTYLLIMCPPRIAPIAFPTGATVIWSAATVLDAFSVRAKNVAILDRIFRLISPWPIGESSLTYSDRCAQQKQLDNAIRPHSTLLHQRRRDHWLYRPAVLHEHK